MLVKIVNDSSCPDNQFCAIFSISAISFFTIFEFLVEGKYKHCMVYIRYSVDSYN